VRFEEKNSHGQETRFFERKLDASEVDIIIGQTESVLKKKNIDMSVLESIQEKGKESSEYKKAIAIYKKIYTRLYNRRLKEIFIASAENSGHINDMDIDEKMNLAVSTYVVYMQSRDGAGTSWSNKIDRTNDSYLKNIDRLYDVVHRLEGVQVFQIDAYMFFMGEQLLLGNGFSKWNKENVMIYCDPTYLQEDKNAYDGDIKPLDIEEYNPGIHYKHYWTYEQHEAFLKCIQCAKCKILVSNYDDKKHLYKDYLEEGYGLKGKDKKNFTPWHRLEYETKTSMSNHNNADTERTEVLWYNYDR
jgi:hypothetical protein